MKNMSLDSNEGIKARIMNGKPIVRDIQSRPLKDKAKQIEFTKQAQAMLDRISSLENNTEAEIKML